MKKILLSALMCAFIVGITACDEFLKEEPRSTLTAVAYYQTESQIRGNVNYLYRNGAPSVMTTAGSAYVGPFTSVTGMLSGYFSNSYEGQETVCMYARQLTRQTYTNLVSTTMDNVWDACFSAINVANGAIKYIPEVDFTNYDPDVLMAEARFFRAFNYFLLTKTFGDVPLSTDFISQLTDDIYPSRTAQSQIYSLIEEDLQYAMQYLPSTTFYNNGCRISKPVAAMVLANVFMQEGKYSDALSPLSTVMSAGHSLLTNDDTGENSAYNKIRTTDGSAESIYSYEYNTSISTGGWWPTYAFNSQAVNVFDTYAIFERVYGPNARFMNVYEADDLRVQNQQVFVWNYTNPNNGAEWTCGQDADGNDLPGMWCYFEESAMLETGYASKDRDIYRYAEALLDYAECIAQTSGVTAEAAGYLAQVKARAYTSKTQDSIASELQSMSKDDFIHECWTERLREFPGEFKIWDDCLRTGMFPNISETEKGKVTYETLIGAQNGSGYTFKDTDLLWPISLNAIQRNPNLLPQNAGYASE